MTSKGFLNLFKKSLDLFQSKHAVIDRSGSLTYLEVENLSNIICHNLSTNKNTANGTIVLFLPRTSATIVSILGIWKADCIYLPIDPTFPQERINYIIQDSKASAIISTPEFSEKLEHLAIDILHFDDLVEERNQNISPLFQEEKSAYKIYTSGSTGLPKGVNISHASFSNLLQAMQEILDLQESDQFYALTTISFDISLLELFLPLTLGATVVIAGNLSRDNPQMMIEDLHTFNISAMQATPAQWQLLLDVGWSGNSKLKAISGGENLTTKLANRLFTKVGKLWNMYGPTETTIWSTYYIVDDAILDSKNSKRSIPIGYPIRKTSLYVLDDAGNNVSADQLGELFIGGDGVAIGYINDLEKTAERFVTITRSGTEQRVYKTGDIVKILPNGALEFIQRNDLQVKLNGHRIELKEIESVIRSSNIVKEVVVKPITPLEETTYLTAFYTINQESKSAKTLGINQIRSLYDNIYSYNKADEPVIGWINSYTNQPFTAEEMESFYQNTYHRVSNYISGDILEIGFGEGHLMKKMIPSCNNYTGIELSKNTSEHINKNLFKNYKNKVQLLYGEPVEVIQNLDQFDFILINSVAQYFPSISYLKELLISLCNKIGEGFIFIGDVRNPRLQKSFYRSLLSQRNNGTSSSDDEEIIEQMFQSETELFIDYLEFQNLLNIEKVADIRFLTKDSPFDTEMDLFRYDVLIHISSNSKKPSPEHSIDYIDSYPDQLTNKLNAGKHSIVKLSNVPDIRLIPFSEKQPGSSIITYGIPNWKAIADQYNYRLEIQPSSTSNNNLDLYFYTPCIEAINLPSSTPPRENFTPQTDSTKNIKNAEIFEEILRETLREKLPAYMIPERYVMLDEFPLTHNWKIDRDRLTVSDKKVERKNASVAPKNEREKLLVEIWKEVLGMDDLGITDNFFSLGGSSIKALLIIAKVYKQHGLTLHVQDFFQFPIIEKMVQALTQDAKEIVLVDESSYYPVSPMEESIWLLCNDADASRAYNIVYISDFLSEPDFQLVEKTILCLINKHESLRTAYSFSDELNGVQQYISPTDNTQFSLNVDDKLHSNAKLTQFIIDEKNYLFDLSNPSLFRCFVKKKENGKWVLIWNIHHIITDGWSMNMLFDEFEEIYKQLAELRYIPDHSKIQNKDHSIWYRKLQESDSTKKMLNYWRDQLSDYVPFELTSDRPRAKLKTYNGDQLTVPFTADLAKIQTDLARKEKTSEYTIALSAFFILLKRYTQQSDLLVGTPITTRTHSQLQSIAGMLLNTVPIRSKLSEEKTFNEVLLSTERSVQNARENGVLAFNKVVSELVDSPDLARNPLFDIMFVWEEYFSEEKTERNVIAKQKLTTSHSSFVKFDLTILIQKEEGIPKLTLEYNTDLFDKWRIQQIAQHFFAILQASIKQADAPIKNINVPVRPLPVPAQETQHPLSTLMHRFEQQVVSNPNNTAVIFCNNALTYETLNRKANQLANHLISSYQIKPGDVIACFMDRSDNYIVTLLGILKTGACYIPLASDLPTERIQHILNESETSVVITSSEMHFPVSDVAVLLLDGESLNSSVENPKIQQVPESLAYIIYTSGTSGQPKGVMISHSAIVSYCNHLTEQHPISKKDCMGMITSPTFDLSYTALWPALLTGASVCVLPEIKSLNHEEISNFFRSMPINILKLTPTILQSFLDLNIEFHPNLRRLFVGGEVLPMRLVEQFQKRFNSVEIVNHYGPTETTVGVITHALKPGEICPTATVPIGKPLPGIEVFVFDAELHHRPIGFSGELYIAGQQLSKGYLCQPEVTAKSFIKHPKSGAVLYKTGDIVQQMPDGTILYIGRKDHQVKVNGIRVEIEEIIHQIGSISEIKNVAISFVDNSINAYIVTTRDVELSELRNQLALKLPEYMIPTHFYSVDSIPVTPNGKTDFEKLKENHKQAVEFQNIERGALHEKILQLFKEVLNRDDIQYSDSFFNSGGHSLKAMQLCFLIQSECNLFLELNSIFRYPTVDQLTVYLNEKKTLGGIPKIKDTELYKTSPQQQSIWSLSQTTEGNQAYNATKVYKLTGAVDALSLEQCFKLLLKKHTSLRTAIIAEQGGLFQRILPVSTSAWKYIDQRSQPATDTQINFLIRKTLNFSFNLEEGSLFKAIFVEFDKEVSFLLFYMHHICIDKWSFDLFFNNLLEAYVTGGEKPSESELSYGDYTHWLRTEIHSDENSSKSYWNQQLSGSLPYLELPFSGNRSDHKSFLGKTSVLILPDVDSKKVQQLAVQHQVSPFSIYYSLTCLLLYTETRVTDIITGTHFLGRSRSDLEKIVGMFVNTLPIRVQINKELSIVELAKQVYHNIVSGQIHETYPFAQIVSDLGLKPEINKNPLFGITVAYNQITVPQTSDLLPFQIEPIESDTYGGSSKFDISFTFNEHTLNNAVHFSIEYNASLYNDEQIANLSKLFLQLLDEATFYPDLKISTLKSPSQD
ncbi:amino acid adenylation domain-containing protein [Polaribacter sp.]|uniref:amino acid adenylation domain-containing protein n=1 Tax=Polaribacter sp. TaxID=1920175 RepID=UPI003EFA51AF